MHPLDFSAAACAAVVVDAALLQARGVLTGSIQSTAPANTSDPPAGAVPGQLCTNPCSRVHEAAARQGAAAQSV